MTKNTDKPEASLGTVPHEPGGPSHHPSSHSEELPRSIDHFRIVKQIGAGSFGRVLLAHDTLLARDVVLKVPRRNTFLSQRVADDFVEEARKAAMLEHPGIVRIYHIGMFEYGPFIVQPYIAGGDLRQALRKRQFSFIEAVQVMAEIAETVSFAHQHRIVHRDLKPANILLDNGKPLVADFGLAIHESQQPQSRGVVAGTWQYMSPEQIRGESHRLDGRSDVWSLGVMLYQLLVGKLPFPFDDFNQLRDAICQQPPRPPRQLNNAVPSELERICLRCLSAKMVNRYSTASDLSTELREWLESTRDKSGDQPNGVRMRLSDKPSAAPQSSFVELEVVPKGLKAFDENDHDFFESLLPGPRAKDRVPEQIRYWLSKIDCDRKSRTFSVGLIYGPSGCGKSSFVRAGLIPRLPMSIDTIFIESTDSDTEIRLARALRDRYPSLPPQGTLPELIALLREETFATGGTKLLIVLDQFEQWLNAKDVAEEEAMIAALRQCDGSRIQAILLVRDEFWMRASRLFQELEITLVEHENFRTLDLFEPKHARSVLAAFGRAYGTIPAASETAENTLFLNEAVKRLTVDGKVICIHLVLLAETLKHKPWAIQSLGKGCELQHIGRDYLEMHLSSRSANPHHKFYEHEIREVLRGLLPSAGTDIRARFRAQSELAKAANLDAQSKQFMLVIEILEKELRLISAVDPVQKQGEGSSRNFQEPAESQSRYYQLTHDFLVPSVRSWLEEADRQTAAGRAQLRLQTLAESYGHTGDKRFLPTVLEFLSILRHVSLRKCDPGMRSVYRMALLRFLGQASVAALILVIGIGLLSLSRWQEAKRRADDWVRTWLTAQTGALPVALKAMQAESYVIVSAMNRRLSDASTDRDDRQRLYLGLGLLGVNDDESRKAIVESIEFASSEELPLIRTALSVNKPAAWAQIQGQLARQVSEESQIKYGLVAFHLGYPDPLQKCLSSSSEKPMDQVMAFAIGRDADSLEHYISHLNDAAEREHDQIATIVKGLALQNWRAKPKEVRLSFEAIAKKLHAESPSGAMHSACCFALKQLGSKVVEKPSQAASRWFVVEDSLTFVKVDGSNRHAGLKFQVLNEEMRRATLEIEESFTYWISTTEVPSQVFAEYARTNEFKNESTNEWKQGDPDLPAVNVTAGQAFGFCNWLSKKHGRKPFYLVSDSAGSQSEDVNSKSDDKTKSSKPDSKWKIDLSSNGFHVPGFFETAFAISGESISCLPPGPALMTRVFADQTSWFAENTPNQLQVQPIAHKLPNAFGVFDILGNASELVVQPVDGRIAPIQKMLAASIESSLQEIEHPALIDCSLRFGRPNLSFRLACSVHDR